jgi:hypothetical protein
MHFAVHIKERRQELLVIFQPFLFTLLITSQPVRVEQTVRMILNWLTWFALSEIGAEIVIAPMAKKIHVANVFLNSLATYQLVMIMAMK